MTPQEIAERSAGNLLPVPWIEPRTSPRRSLPRLRPGALHDRHDVRDRRGAADALRLSVTPIRRTDAAQIDTSRESARVGFAPCTICARCIRPTASAPSTTGASRATASPTEPNWVDDGALSLGIASYAIVDGDEALIYDTHVSVEHARFIRAGLEAEGVRRFIVLLSHCHLDHVAGTAAFADCEVIATARTAELLTAKRRAIEARRRWRARRGSTRWSCRPGPSRTACASTSAARGSSSSTSTSTATTPRWSGCPSSACCSPATRWRTRSPTSPSPTALDAHLADLERLWRLDPDRILPNHGDPEIIAAGGYGKGLIRATQDYIRVLQRCRTSRAARRPADRARRRLGGRRVDHVLRALRGGAPGEPRGRDRHRADGGSVSRRAAAAARRAVPRPRLRRGPPSPIITGATSAAAIAAALTSVRRRPGPIPSRARNVPRCHGARPPDPRRQHPPRPGPEALGPGRLRRRGAGAPRAGRGHRQRRGRDAPRAPAAPRRRRRARRGGAAHGRRGPGPSGSPACAGRPAAWRSKLRGARPVALRRSPRLRARAR